MYDLIGDIHGHAVPLQQLLFKLGYTPIQGVWQHPERKIIFVGDYIDRGPAIREVLSIVRSMSEAGHAIALMGNHEYNALAYAYETEDGRYLRSHNHKHNHQHQATLDQFADHPEEWESYRQWFRTLKIYLDLPELRAVHACWDQLHINWLKEHQIDTMNDELLVASHERGSQAYRVINDLLKGKEFTIPESFAWHDKDGHVRNQNRIKWWKNPEQLAFGDFLFNCPDALKEKMIQDKVDAVIYDATAPPVFFGHYWMEDHFPVIQSSNVVCLDYSIAKGGSLVAYRWNGEPFVKNENFVHVRFSDHQAQTHLFN